ncbi:MAG: NAD-dependent protein deacylase [Clostridiales bacterium]|nr:NAD-dependent protein deacylase [Clostridiales bacterium]
MNAEIKKLCEIIDESNNIVFFGGAGVSTESGIPDFRSASGLYNQDLGREVSPEEMISHTFYVNHPADFFEFYKDKLIYKEAQPNACHKALAELEKQGKVRAVVTQNIDGLHQKAGSKTVYELHGSTLRNYCERCGAFYDVDAVLDAEGVPYCSKCGGRIKPDVVLYEEGLDQDVIDGAVNAIMNADTLIVGGTTLIVYPAAGLIRYFRGKHLVLINMSATQADNIAELVIREPIGEVFSQVMNRK